LKTIQSLKGTVAFNILGVIERNFCSTTYTRGGVAFNHHHYIVKLERIFCSTTTIHAGVV